MSGMTVEIDDKLRKQVHALLVEYGLLEDDDENAEPEMTYEQAEAILLAELEKGEKSGISELSWEELWAKYK